MRLIKLIAIRANTQLLDDSSIVNDVLLSCDNFVVD